ncbi:hypothetical protein GCM10010234_33040 [Streptomyces hawaiiensis]
MGLVPAEAAPDGAPVGSAPAAAPDGAPDGAPEGAPEGTPEGAPEATPDGAWQACRCPAPPPPFEDDEESPDPQAARVIGDSTSRTTAGTRRARFMRDSSREAEGSSEATNSTNAAWACLGIAL